MSSNLGFRLIAVTQASGKYQNNSNDDSDNKSVLKTLNNKWSPSMKLVEELFYETQLVPFSLYQSHTSCSFAY